MRLRLVPLGCGQVVEQPVTVSPLQDDLKGPPTALPAGGDAAQAATDTLRELIGQKSTQNLNNELEKEFVHRHSAG
jgi:hypothetical protein